MKTRLERRAFLKGALSCMVSLPALTSIGCSDGESLGPEDRLRSAGTQEAAVLAVFFDEPELEAAAFVGQRFLAIVAPNASDDEIDALVAPVVELLASSDSDASALAALRAKILDDFETEATELVDGWVFSVTELRLCLLLATIIQ